MRGPHEVKPSSGILGKRLQKIDYIEYLEKSGKATLQFLLQNQNRVNELSEKLRHSLSKLDYCQDHENIKYVTS
jgi:hypothetical protein